MRVTNFAIVLFPLPDSPTSATISPLNILNDTLFTAIILFLLKIPGD